MATKKLDLQNCTKTKLCVKISICKLIANKNIYRHVPTEILSYHTTKKPIPQRKNISMKVENKIKMNMHCL